MFFHQNRTLFHGPGGGSDSWLSITNQITGDLAVRAGVPKETVLTVQEFATIKKIAWQALASKATMQYLGPRLFALADSVVTARWAYQYYLSITMTNLSVNYGKRGIKGAAARALVQRSLQSTSTGAMGMTTVATKRAARRAIIRRVATRGVTKLGLRVIPYVGWGLLAWDVYTVTTRGELWGVQLYTEEQVAIT
jgi:hypothetical protein